MIEKCKLVFDHVIVLLFAQVNSQKVKCEITSFYSEKSGPFPFEAVDLRNL